MKKDIRIQMMALRKNLDQERKRLADLQLVQHIQKDPRYQQSTIVGLFYPMPQEIDLLPLLKDRKRFVFPKVIENNLHFYEAHSDSVFVKSAFGVMEPTEGPILDSFIEYLIVPALAISTAGYRIGYGKGFYDRFLSDHRPKHVMGVIYSFQETDAFSPHEHDQPLDDYFKVTL